MRRVYPKAAQSAFNTVDVDVLFLSKSGSPRHNPRAGTNKQRSIRTSPNHRPERNRQAAAATIIIVIAIIILIKWQKESDSIIDFANNYS